MTHAKKGFTLVELLIVIGILAILATATTLILNPAELLKQARDQTRMTDLGSIANAIDVYLADVTSPDMDANTTNTVGTYCTRTGGASIRKTATTDCPATANTSKVVTGPGWVSIKFTDISSGSPIATLPLDPANNTGTTSDNCGTTAPTTCYYQYKFDDDNKKYKLAASLESTKFNAKEDGDGGKDADAYEVGSNLDL